MPDHPAMKSPNAVGAGTYDFDTLPAKLGESQRRTRKTRISNGAAATVAVPLPQTGDEKKSGGCIRFAWSAIATAPSISTMTTCRRTEQDGRTVSAPHGFDFETWSPK